MLNKNSPQTIPPGYVQTEIGVIPMDWEIKQLVEIANFYDNLRIPITESKRENGITPYYGANGIQSYVKGHTHDGEFVLIAEDGANDLNNYPVLYVNGKVWVNNHAHVVQGLNGRVETKYLSYTLKTVNFVQSLVGGTRAKLNGSIAKAIKVLIPTDIAEQNAITSILSHTDALIENLEKLIAKKKAIKQGVMQQLLTGKIRLPGFSGEWSKKKLGELLYYEQPTKYLVSDTSYNDNNLIPVLTAGKTFILGYTNEENGVYNSLPVIIFDDFTTAVQFVDFPFKAKSSAMKMLLPINDTVNLRFIFEKMLQIEYPLGDHKRHWIGEYQYLEITVPTLQEEQNAIAKVLSDMNEEIESLERKRGKYKLIKIGMMQQLLTGKIRIYAKH